MSFDPIQNKQTNVVSALDKLIFAGFKFSSALLSLSLTINMHKEHCCFKLCIDFLIYLIYNCAKYYFTTVKILMYYIVNKICKMFNKIALLT